MNSELLNTLRNEFFHASASIMVGFITFFIFHKIEIALFTAFIAIAIDIDHLIEYILANGFKVDLKYFASGKSFHKIKRIYIILHAWEYVLLFGILFALFNKPWLLGTALGLSTHYFVDTLTNKGVKKLVLFLSYRIRVKFDISKLT